MVYSHLCFRTITLVVLEMGWNELRHEHPWPDLNQLGSTTLPFTALTTVKPKRHKQIPEKKKNKMSIYQG